MPQLNPFRFPSDYAHLLMCNDTYENDHGLKKSCSEELSFGDDADADYDRPWQVHQVYENETDSYAFKAVLYLNEPRKQLVLAFRGLTADLKTFFTSAGPLTAQINGVLLNQVVPQLVACLTAAEDANRIARDTGYTLSFTGFSNGAWLAEYAIYYAHRYLDSNKTKLKAVLFDSPGILKSLNEAEPNVINFQQKYNIHELADCITSYLSRPSFSNSCNMHIGNTYRIFNAHADTSNQIEKRLESYVDVILNQLAELKIDMNVLKKTLLSSKFFLRGLFMMLRPEMIQTFIEEFDPETGKPKYCETVKNWPVVDSSVSRKYDKNLKNLIKKAVSEIVDLFPLPNLAKKPGAHLIGSMATHMIDFVLGKFVPGLHLVINVIIEMAEGRLSFKQFESELFDLRIVERRACSAFMEKRYSLTMDFSETKRLENMVHIRRAFGARRRNFGLSENELEILIYLNFFKKVS
jgi:hypothetical protein